MKVMRSHPHLEWVKGLNLPRQMPAQAVAQIMKVEGLTDAKALGRSLDLGMPFRVKGRDEELLQYSFYPSELKDNFPLQLLLSTDIAGLLPFGSSFIRFSLPPTGEVEEAEGFFRNFQDITARICAKLMGAAPFCSLIGFDSQPDWNPQNVLNPLSAKGFTLFFSSDPDRFYSKIEKVLGLELRLRAEREQSPSLQDTRRWDLMLKIASELDVERHNTGDEKAYFLNEIRPYAFSNTLVDLRPE